MRSEEMKRQVERFLQRYQAEGPDCSLIAACSGGRDSVCLLHILSILQVRLGYKLKAVYVHHGLRQEADEEVEWLKDLCEEKQIDFAVRYADVTERAAKERESIEEAARHLRYRILEEEAEEEKDVYKRQVQKFTDSIQISFFRIRKQRHLVTEEK